MRNPKFVKAYVNGGWRVCYQISSDKQTARLAPITAGVIHAITVTRSEVPIRQISGQNQKDMKTQFHRLLAKHGGTKEVLISSGMIPPEPKKLSKSAPQSKKKKKRSTKKKAVAKKKSALKKVIDVLDG